MILKAANFDPLRAQEIEENINQEWFERWSLNNEAQNEAIRNRPKPLEEYGK